MRLAGHLIRHPEEAAHETVLWEPLHGNPKRGAPSMNYVKLLKKDTGLDNVSEIRTVMEDRDGWRERTRRTSSSTGSGEVSYYLSTNWLLLLLICLIGCSCY